MDRFVASVAPLIAENPKLGLLRGAPAAERCRQLRLEKKVAPAQASCAEALRFGDVPSTLVHQANLFLEEKNSDAALGSLNRALRVDPQSTDALRLRQRLLSEREDYLASGRDLLLVRHLRPTDDWIAGRVEWLVKMLNHQGAQLFKAGKNAEAAVYFQLGLELDPDNRELEYRQARASGDQVETLLTEAEARPDDFELRMRIDHALAAKKQYDRVVKMWDPFIDSHPEDPRPRYERGGAKWRLQQRTGALEDMQKACSLGLAQACRDHTKMSSMAR